MARHDIGYDYEDCGMDEHALALKYAQTQQHPVYNETTWLAYKAMPTRDVKLDYWPWVVEQIAEDDFASPSSIIEPDASAFQEQLTEQQVADAELIPIETIDQFAGMIAHWHGGVIHKLDHLLNIPAGQTVTVQIKGQPEDSVELTGDALRGFRAGLLTAKLQFDSLPFAVSVDDAIDPPAAGEPDASAPKH